MDYGYLCLSFILVTSPIWIWAVGKAVGDALYAFFEWLEE